MAHSYKSTFDFEKLEISTPVKNTSTGTWDCDITYDNKPLTISMPKVALVKDTGMIIFKGKHLEEYLKTVENIETLVCDHLYKNSREIFNGKVFEENKFKNSLRPSIEIDSQNNIVYFQTDVSSDVKSFDTFGDKINFSDVGNSVSVVVKVEKCSFTKELFDIRYMITQIKSRKPEKLGVSFDIPVEKKEVVENAEESENFFD